MLYYASLQNCCTCSIRLIILKNLCWKIFFKVILLHVWVHIKNVVCFYHFNNFLVWFASQFVAFASPESHKFCPNTNIVFLYLKFRILRLAERCLEADCEGCEFHVQCLYSLKKCVFFLIHFQIFKFFWLIPL